MNVAEKLVQILEENDIEHVFGLPGEQILAFYKALDKSSIKHVLLRHEQAAAHAADAYSRSSKKLGVCISTASPGALNMVMGVATAFKDNVPILVITGDNSTDIKDSQEFQSFPLARVFENITFKNYDPKNGQEAIANLIEIMQIFKREPSGPIHLNLSKNILMEDVEIIPEVNYVPIYSYPNLEEVYKKIKNSKKPLLILGSGARDSGIDKLASESNVPTATTYPGRGIVSELETVNLGLIGNRGNERTRYALANSDCVIAIGTRLTERTLKEDISDKLIHVNIDSDVLQGKFKLHMDSGVFTEDLELPDSEKWLEEILDVEVDSDIDGILDESLPLRAPSAIYSILNSVTEEIIVSDAGAHTTWTTLLSECIKPGQLLFSGGLAPMGYGLPAAVGAAFANSQNIVLINGDGDFQMNMQELATVSENNLPVTICILNNSSYSVIKQTERNVYEMDPYEVDLFNPDFVEIAGSYGIEAVRVTAKSEVESEVSKGLNMDKPYLIEIIVKEEDIPLPKI